ncbi:MAG: hypothetical protein HY682_07155 [Chloroflexi bacterium]|nr:hypothetical protein [Chloroflexota bacterium]
MNHPGQRAVPEPFSHGGPARRRLQRIRIVTAIAVAMATLAGCDPEAQGPREPATAPGAVVTMPKTSHPDRTYTVEDLRLAGWKPVRQYDISGLPHATEAWHGFLGQIEFEARFYSNHADAIAYGTEWAEAVTGPNATVFGPGVRWEEGARDRRRYNAPTGTHGSGSYTPRYGDFVIAGNIVLLCDGADSVAALLNCQSFLAHLK